VFSPKKFRLHGGQQRKLSWRGCRSAANLPAGLRNENDASFADCRIGRASALRQGAVQQNLPLSPSRSSAALIALSALIE
jgi:hypothetical protein